MVDMPFLLHIGKFFTILSVQKLPFLVLFCYGWRVSSSHCCPKCIFIILYIKGLVEWMEDGCEYIKPYG